MTSAGDEVHSSSCRARAAPSTSSSPPPIRARVMEVWTPLRTSSSRPAPRSRATTTLAPTDRPMKMLTIRLMREVVEPTAARASGPAKRPTTTTSAALKRSCSRLDSISGRANSSSFPARGPWTMSI